MNLSSGPPTDAHKIIYSDSSHIFLTLDIDPTTVKLDDPANELA